MQSQSKINNLNQPNDTKTNSSTFNEQEFLANLHQFTLAMQKMTRTFSDHLEDSFNKKGSVESYFETTQARIRGVAAEVGSLGEVLLTKGITPAKRKETQQKLITLRNEFLDRITFLTKDAVVLQNISEPVPAAELAVVNNTITNFVKMIPQLQKADQDFLAQITKEEKEEVAKTTSKKSETEKLIAEISLENVLARLEMIMQIKETHIKQLVRVMQEGYKLVSENLKTYRDMHAKNLRITRGLKIHLTRFVNDEEIWGDLVTGPAAANISQPSEVKANASQSNILSRNINANFKPQVATAPPLPNPEPSAPELPNSRRSAQVNPGIFGNSNAPIINKANLQNQSQNRQAQGKK